MESNAPAHQKPDYSKFSTGSPELTGFAMGCLYGDNMDIATLDDIKAVVRYCKDRIERQEATISRLQERNRELAKETAQP